MYPKRVMDYTLKLKSKRLIGVISWELEKDLDNI